MHYSHVHKTPIHPPVTYSKQLISLGSCFADQIGQKLKGHRFNIECNPYGVVYNPYTLCTQLRRSIDDVSPNSAGFLINDDIWYHHDYHSSINSESKEELLHKLNNLNEVVKEQLASADYLILTLGSAMVYRHTGFNLMVGNCHKVPQSQFTQEMLSARDISTRLSSTLAGIWDFNPHLNVILTVSPVRYLKDGAIHNTRSKAQLITSAMLLEERHQQVTYWPAYEIFMDQLRGYRWVESDLVHPNAVAVDIIWEAFVQSAMAEQTINILDRVVKLNAQIAHRPFNPRSASHQKFVDSLTTRILAFNEEYPDIPLSVNEIIV